MRRFLRNPTSGKVGHVGSVGELKFDGRRAIMDDLHAGISAI
jgi:hypothetical protein